MEVAWTLLIWLTRTLALAILVVTLLPFVRTGWWLVRLCDFPRLQLSVLSAGAALTLLLIGVFKEWRVDFWALVPLLVLAALWQAMHVARYSRIWPAQVGDAEGKCLRLVISNLDFRNERREEAARVLRSLDPDMLLLVEIDARWADALKGIRAEMRHHIEAVLPSGLGLSLWCNCPLDAGEVRYLVSEKRPSLHVDVRFPGGEIVRIVGLHPVPPALPRDHGKRTGKTGASAPTDRHDSRLRDAELVLVGREVAQHDRRNWVVAGDFNDVAWSHTTRLFTRVSGLRDPRVGRSLLTTYHAKYPLLRYPLDHVFVSPRFNVGRFERVRVPGSDHFGVLIELQIGRGAKVDERTDAKDRRESERIVREGAEDAAAQGANPS